VEDRLDEHTLTVEVEAVRRALGFGAERIEVARA
jgi:hypothetical protein